MTEDELAEIRRQLADLQDQHEALMKLPEQVTELNGKFDVLQAVVLAKLNNVGATVEKANGIRTAITFASIVIVPILVALIGGYFALRGAAK